tara:strand:- start:629 stop:907 length:279 start_codon:yes stop_codon:yes gene_type:complete
LAVVKSKLINNLSDNWPNFLKKDLSKLVEITLVQIEKSLERNERVELRDIFTLESRTQKARTSRNPKTNEIIKVPKKKKQYISKCQKNGLKI